MSVTKLSTVCADADEAVPLQVYCLGGTCCRVEAAAAWTVLDAKHCVERSLGWSAYEQQLVLGTEILDNSTPVRELRKEGAIEIMLVRRSGPVANWFQTACPYLEFATDLICGDFECVQAAVAAHGYQLRFASRELLRSRSIVLRALASYGRALEYAADSLRADKEAVLRAVSNDGCALQFAAECLRSDREVVLRALEQDAMALQFAADCWKADEGVVLQAVSCNGLALQFASQSMKQERAVVEGAVRNRGLALEFASEAFKADREIVRIAVSNNWRAKAHAAGSVHHDDELVAEEKEERAPPDLQPHRPLESAGLSTMGILQLLLRLLRRLAWLA